jgi:hypothetical protein
MLLDFFRGHGFSFLIKDRNVWSSSSSRHHANHLLNNLLALTRLLFNLVLRKADHTAPGTTKNRDLIGPCPLYKNILKLPHNVFFFTHYNLKYLTISFKSSANLATAFELLATSSIELLVC